MGLINIIWFVFVGWWQACAFLILSALLAVTVVGLPLAKALFNFAKLSAFPFGKEIISETELKGQDNVSSLRKIGGLIVNIIWLPFGISIAFSYIVFGIALFCTIIYIPAGIVYVRSAKFLIWPVGAKVVTKKQAYAAAVVNEMERRNRR